jgi:FMN phosphatase YigB (HAD superfamily)
MLKYIFFDVYQTLLDVDIELKNFDKSFVVFEEFLRNKNIKKSQAARFREYFDSSEQEFYKTHDRNLYHRDWLDTVVHVMRTRYNVDLTTKEAQSLLWVFRQKSCAFCHPYRGVASVLKSLSQQYVLSTASYAHGSITEIEFEKFGIGKYFTHLFFTSNIGFRKPSREFFESILNTKEGRRYG